MGCRRNRTVKVGVVEEQRGALAHAVAGVPVARASRIERHKNGGEAAHTHTQTQSRARRKKSGGCDASCGVLAVAVAEGVKAEGGREEGAEKKTGAERGKCYVCARVCVRVLQRGAERHESRLAHARRGGGGAEKQRPDRKSESALHAPPRLISSLVGSPSLPLRQRTSSVDL